MRKRHEEPAFEEASEELMFAGSLDQDSLGTGLRPQDFEGYIGQRTLVEKIQVYVRAAKQRGDALDHVLLHGPPGLGKTTLAQIIAGEMGSRLHSTSGPAIEHKGILSGLLTALGQGDVLFIDEIHRLSPAIEEILYSAMEDGRIDIPMGEGSHAHTMSISLAPFTLIGATTRTALLSAPLRDRFPIIEGLRFYEDHELATIVKHSAAKLGFEIDEAGALAVGHRSRGTPRIANRLTRRLRDFLQVSGEPVLTETRAIEFLARLEIDDEGLTPIDRRMLELMYHQFDGGPVGIEAIAASLGLPRDTIEDVHEPFLLQREFILRTPRGRMLTKKSEKHIAQDCG